MSNSSANIEMLGGDKRTNGNDDDDDENHLGDEGTDMLLIF